MDNHPIPQDVTGFQFHLIGEMTIKQFVYLAAGVVAGLLCYILPIPPVIKLPLVFLLSLFGVALAFFPIAGRPMDVMTLNFIRAIFSPNQYVYQKTGVTFSPLPDKIAASQKQEQVKQVHFTAKPASSPIGNKLDHKENSFFESIGQMTPPAPQVLSQRDIEPKEEVLEKQAETLEKELETVKKEETSLPSQSPTLSEIHQKAIDLEKELQAVRAQKEQLRNELITLKQSLEMQKKQAFAPGVMTQKTQTSQTAKQVPKGMQNAIGIPMSSDAPNLISGILKDPRGNPLPGILVEIKDKEGNAVRAFKTNGLGQFISATPLQNGTYRIEFDDPKKQNQFEAVEIQAVGAPILPIQVTSVDQREELRRDLFGPTKTA